MKILVIGNVLNNPAMERAAREAGVTLDFLSSYQARHLPESFDSWDFDLILAGLDHGDHTSLLGSRLLDKPVIIAPVSGENIAAGITTLSSGTVERINAYFAYGGRENLRNGFLLLKSLAAREQRLKDGHGETIKPEDEAGPRDFGDVFAPRPVALDSIYTFDGSLYGSLEDFLKEQGREYPLYVGILSYRGRWADGDLAVEPAIAESLNRRGIGVITAYTDGSPDQELGTLTFEAAVDRFFCLEGKPFIDLLVNFQFFGTKGGDGKDMFSRAADCFAGLDIPVIRPTSLGGCDLEKWEKDIRPYTRELPTNFIVPELQGMIEPIHVACSDTSHHRAPICDRVERLTGRIEKWLTLRRRPNGEKRVVIMLHNAPCSGVEATVGQATDLDALDSAVNILRRLKEEGYRVTGIPENGEELKRLIFRRKAFSDFRWTAAGDILESGGVLFRMDGETYHTWYDRLSGQARRKMEESWGKAPGEAMVLEGTLLITGLDFGNVLVMVQPKRGCYGAKCTGEVCKILQDPDCPPTHQYLATYWYIQHQWKADAVIHLGTHGSLEYLPGKDCGLSKDCFSDIAIGDILNLYPYCASVVAQALLAKRRSYAVTLSYLPAPGKGLDGNQRRLAESIRRYFEAKEQDNGQAGLLKEEIETLAARSEAAERVFKREPDFDAALRELREMLVRTARQRKGTGMRALGAVPDRQWIRDYITELWLSEPGTASLWDGITDSVNREEAISRLIDLALEEMDAGMTLRKPEGQETENLLIEDAKELAAGLIGAGAELDHLVHALSGGYIRPTAGGEAACGGRGILPTGRNIYGVEADKIPTPGAFLRGRQAAEELVALYEKETGKKPEKIGMNMTSLDVTRTGGEQLGQFLSLLGIRPVWSDSGRVESLEVIPLDELGRPRIDVTARISSVMRDAWPDVLVMMDRAVSLAEGQDEGDEDNYVRANSRVIGEKTEYASGRIFGGQPGTYTSAVGLALKASAWKNEDDLARYFIDSSSYLYGENKDGVRTVETFAANVRQIEVTCDITSSRKTDAIASSYSARVQGGFRMAAKALGSKKVIRQYMGESGDGKAISVVSMEEHVSKAIRETLLNDVWLEQEKASGYQGAADIMNRLRNVFETQCVCGNITDKTLNEIAGRYLTDEQTRKWFEENNPYALEEAGRRFLELYSRGKWNPDQEIIKQLRRAYLQAEGDLEDGVTGAGEIQAGSVDIIAHDQVESWDRRLRETDEVISQWTK